MSRPPPPLPLARRMAAQALRAARPADLNALLALFPAGPPEDPELLSTLCAAGDAWADPRLLRLGLSGLLRRPPATAAEAGQQARWLLRIGEAEGALGLLRGAGSRFPEDDRLQADHALQAEAMRRFEEAAAAAARAHAAAPASLDHRALLARLSWRLDQRERAEALWRSILEEQPGHVPSLRNLAAAATNRQAEAEALDLRRRALAAEPGRAELTFELAHALDRADQTEAGRALLATLPPPAAAPAAWRWAWARLQMLPTIHPDAEAERASVQRWWADLAELRARGEGAPAAAQWGAIEPAFPLHYLVEDARPAQEALGAVVAGIARAAHPRLCAPPPARSGRGLRVGFASAFFRRHTVGRLFSGWASGLAARGVEVHALHSGSRADAATAALGAAGVQLHHLPGPALAQIDHLRGLQLDALLFPELGMDLDTAWVAAARCAPMQAMGWGHPITSGLPTVDWFFSSAAMEPPGGEAAYTEALLRLPGLSIAYARPPAALPADRGALGLPIDGPLLLCLQSLFKLRPEHDAIFAQIAAGAPEATLAFVAHPSAAATARFADRLRAALRAQGARAEQVQLVPQQAQPRFLALIAAADVILDGPGWSGGNTTLEAVAQGQPVVCRWGPTLRARHSAAILETIGLGHTVGHSDADYVRRALSLAHDPAERARTAEATRDGAPRAFDGSAALDALAEALHQQTGRG